MVQFNALPLKYDGSTNNLGNFKANFCFHGAGTIHLPPLMENQTKQLLVKSQELFMKYGIKNLTMDDIARELGMSKKTIYRSVENKADLVMMVIKHYLEEETRELEEVLKTSKHSIDEMIRMIEHFSTKISEFNASALYDMKKYYPEAWKIYNHHQFQNVFNRISANLKTGVSEGMYREDLDTDVVARLYIGNIDTLLNPDYFPVKKYTFWETYKQYLSYHLHGVVSNKGLKVLEEIDLLKK